MSVADWIMRVATRNPPPAKRDWAHAMQAEYDVLQAGHLAWAFGCLSAVMQWRFRNDAFYVLLLVAILYLANAHVLDGLSGQAIMAAGVPQLDLNIFVTATGLSPTLIVNNILLCAAACAYRPDRAFTTAATLILVNQLFFPLFLLQHPDQAAVIFAEMRRGEPIRSYGAPMFSALGAEIGWSFVGCHIGIAINRMLMGRSRA